MIAKAQANYIRISPRKLRQVIALVKGRNPEQAIDILANVNKRASIYIAELLKSAVANAKRLQQGMDTSNLYISKLIANGGPMLKRYRAASMGRASIIRKRTSHLIVELDTQKIPDEAVSVPASQAGSKKMKKAAGKIQPAAAAPTKEKGAAKAKKSTTRRKR